MAGLDALRQYLADLAGPSQYFRDETGQLRPKPSALADGVQYAGPADVETLQEPAFSPVDLIDPDILKAMYIPASKKVLNALADGDLATRVFSALHDRMPRVEIPDAVPGPLGNFYAQGDNARLREFYPSQTFDEIPSTGDIRYFAKGEGVGASYHSQGDYITGPRHHVEGMGFVHNPETIAHELQHAVQERGGFARGGSPEQFVNYDQSTINQIKDALSLRALMQKNGDDDIVKSSKLFVKIFGREPARAADVTASKNSFEKLNAMLSEAENFDPMASYRKLAGEIEARDTAARMSMNAFERARTQPYTGYQVRPDGSFGPAYDVGGNIPLEDYIVRR